MSCAPDHLYITKHIKDQTKIKFFYNDIVCNITYHYTIIIGEYIYNK